MEKQFLTLEKLQNRIISLEEERIAVTNALDIALKINDIQPDAAAETTVESILALCYERTGKLIGLRGEPSTFSGRRTRGSSSPMPAPPSQKRRSKRNCPHSSTTELSRGSSRRSGR